MPPSLNDPVDLATTIAELESGLPPRADAGFLGARLEPQQARLVLLQVPWEATTSYGRGTARGPAAMIRASHQLDLEDPLFGASYRQGIASLAPDPSLVELNAQASAAALRAIAALEQGEAADEADLALVNQLSDRVNRRVQAQAKEQLDEGRIVGLMGGDHSSPFGLIQALTERYPEGFGILHVDAHHDLREAYEGFVWSHASIFHNLLERLPRVIRLVQYGIRDYSRAEAAYARAQGERLHCCYDAERFAHLAAGRPLVELLDSLVERLPARVYVSFDIDGLDPALCPSTGTPVPGGPGFNEAALLLHRLVESGREIIGFDLCEVAPDAQGGEWDANVGARLLYKLCGATLASRCR